LTAHGINDVRQNEMHTSKLLVPEPSYFKDEVPIVKLKRYMAPPGTDIVLAEMIPAEGNTLCSDIH
jgi:hypothetical protein